MSKFLRTLCVTLGILLAPAWSWAQAATITYTVVATSPAVAQTYAPVLYVNGTALVAPLPTCVAAGVDANCTAQRPDITAALTASGAQRFELALRNGPLEGLKSLPLVLTRPGAPTNLQFP